MGGCDSRICTTLEKGGQKIAVFLTLGTPICCQLLEYTVICKSESDKSVVDLQTQLTS